MSVLLFSKWEELYNSKKLAQSLTEIVAAECFYNYPPGQSYLSLTSVNFCVAFYDTILPWWDGNLFRMKLCGPTLLIRAFADWVLAYSFSVILWMIAGGRYDRVATAAISFYGDCSKVEGIQPWNPWYSLQILWQLKIDSVVSVNQIHTPNYNSRNIFSPRQSRRPILTGS